MSANVSSSSAFIISSSILNPILALGVFVYCDKIIVSSWTWTKLPLIKYTPFDIEKDGATANHYVIEGKCIKERVYPLEDCTIFNSAALKAARTREIVDVHIF